MGAPFYAKFCSCIGCHAESCIEGLRQRFWIIRRDPPSCLAIEHSVNGVVTAHDDVFAAVVNAATTNGDPVVLDVARTSGGNTIFSLSIEMICVAKS